MKRFILVMFILLSASLFCSIAQPIVVSGIVFDEYNETLPGVCVYVRGTTNGTMTDINGEYSIRCLLGQTLIFSCIGFIPKIVEVNTDRINVILMDDLDWPIVSGEALPGPLCRPFNEEFSIEGVPLIIN